MHPTEPRLPAASSHAWIGRFAARLMQLEPRLSQMRAVWVAVAVHGRDAEQDPVESADRYASRLTRPANPHRHAPSISAGDPSARYRDRFRE